MVKPFLLKSKHEKSKESYGFESTSTTVTALLYRGAFLLYTTFIRNKPMTVRHEIKSQLAKLLATEDLVVENKNVETACFNVHTRVLTLPNWDKAGNEIYDMLVAHEVGHALYTPDRDWIKEYKIPPQFVNVVEDVRIEKMMKRRYAGISKTFYKGYNVLADEDFFGVECEDVSKMNLADRVNLHFKIGNFVDIPFGEDVEMSIVRMIKDCENFDDVLIAAQTLYKYCKEQMNTETKTDMDSLESQSSGSSEEQSDNSMEQQQQPGESEDSTDTEQDTTEQDTAEQDTEHVRQGGETNPEPKVDTMDSLEDAIKKLASMDGFENVYIELPQVNLDDIIVPNGEIHERCDELWDNPHDPYLFDYVDSEFLKFKKSAQKEVNYLVKEFECRKSANSYARATTSRTGVLDCSKLHTYKYNEDLFKKVTTLADGKDHGLIFILDWSGSMGNVLMDTMKQLFNLVWFCKKVSIPFEVYAFTNEYPLMSDDGEHLFRKRPYEKKDGLAQIHEYFSLMNILSYKVNSKTLEKQIKNMFRIAQYINFGARYPIPHGMGLSGTPLDETMIALHQIIPQFKKNTKVQKVQCVVLTDGEGYGLTYHREIQRSWECEPFIGVGRITDNCYLRDRKTGNTYSLNSMWDDYTDILIQNLRDNFTDTNFIGIRVLESRDSHRFISRYTFGEYKLREKIQNQWKKEKSFSIKNSGYHSYIALSATTLTSESEFEVSEDASKTQIKKSFMKSLKNKKMNKKILNEFVGLVA